MGKKIVIDIGRGEFKLFKDFTIITQNCGYEQHLQPIEIYGIFCKGKDTLLTRLRYNLIKIPIFIKSLIQIPNDSKILFIYPHPFGILIRFFFYFLKLKKCNITMLCADIDYFRGLNKSLFKEVNNLNSAHKILLHTPNMLNACRKANIKTPADIIHLFDYITDYTAPLTNGEEGFRIAFAGNFNKAPFINQLKKLNCNQMKFLLYGSPNNNLITNNWIEYKGCFTPDNISEVHGDWGLVWDGDSLENGNSGNMYAEYLKINYPYKTSLYIVANLPLIVWKESGIAQFVEENHLGITIDSLYEIEEKILSLSSEEKEIMKKSVRDFAQKLKNGEILTAVLNKIN